MLGARNTEKPYRVIQSLYTDCTFYRLLDLISGFLAKHYFVSGEEAEDNLRRNPAMKRWKASGIGHRASVIAYTSRSEATSPRSGSVMVARHVRREVNDGLSGLSDIPLEIRSRLDGVPNVLEIETHYWWDFLYNPVARNLAVHLTGARCRVFMMSLTDDIVLIKRNPLLTPDERFELIVSRMERPTYDADRPSRAAALIKTRARPVWDALTAPARRFLTTGITLFDTFEVLSQSLLDMSPASVALAKAFETTLAERILHPFRRWFHSSPALSGRPLADDKRNDQRRALARFLSDATAKPLEMGTLAFTLRLLVDNPGLSTQSVALGALNAYIHTLATPEYFLNRDALLADLNIITTRYRNGAAHTDLQPLSVVEEFMEFLLGSHGQTGALARLIAASEPSTT